ncbi:hypothetical protein JZ751_000996 [Albula glossodonta]|uniref:Uncharacterized protein n=1 Tax=Albula glossodonta TaxID=121402 RepID=A0A8T2PX92_9TELE|nr:hypothetical protein JZ751_000996 [Albula glossodonta]
MGEEVNTLTIKEDKDGGVIRYLHSVTGDPCRTVRNISVADSAVSGSRLPIVAEVSWVKGRHASELCQKSHCGVVWGRDETCWMKEAAVTTRMRLPSRNLRKDLLCDSVCQAIPSSDVTSDFEPYRTQESHSGLLAPQLCPVCVTLVEAKFDFQHSVPMQRDTSGVFSTQGH